MTTNQSLYEACNSALSFCFNCDEGLCDYYSILPPSQNGQYYYNSNRLRTITTLPLPSSMLNNMKSNEHKKRCGLFVDINRAYFIDFDSIYLWNYGCYDGNSNSNSNQWCCVNQFSNRIECVHMCKPKANIFISEVQYLLIVAVRNELSIIGLGFINDSVENEISVFPTKYKLTLTDDLRISQIISHENGRIFCCTFNGSIYEVQYSFDKNIFGQPVRKFMMNNMSDSYAIKLMKNLSFPFPFAQQSINQNSIQNKNILDIILLQFRGFDWLFTLSTQNVICAYAIRNKTNDQRSTGKLIEYRKCLTDAQLRLQHTPIDMKQTNTRLVTLCAIAEYENMQSNVALIAVTNDGDRMFLELRSISNHHSLHLRFIRLRPPFLELPMNISRYAPAQAQAQAPAIQFGSPRNVNNCWYSNGITLFNSEKQGTDSLVVIARDSITCQKHSLMKLEEMVECGQSLLNQNEHKIGDISDIAEIPASHYISSHGYLLYSRGQMHSGGQPLIGLSQFAIQHLIPPRMFVVLSYDHITQYKYLRIIDIFEILLQQKNLPQIDQFVKHYGVCECQAMLVTIICCDSYQSNTSIIAFAVQMFEERVYPLECDVIYHQSIMNHHLFCGSSHIFALYLWLSRMLRSIWYYSIITFDGDEYHPRFEFNHFQNINKYLSTGLYFMNLIKQRWNTKQNKHHLILSQIISLVERCIQTFHVCSMVCKSRDDFNHVFTALTIADQSNLKQMQFQSLILSSAGESMMKSIVLQIVSKFGTEDAKLFQKQCPLFFNISDLLIFDANAEMSNGSSMKRVLDMYKLAIKEDIHHFDLHGVCDALRNNGSFIGAVDLALHVRSLHINDDKKIECENEIYICLINVKNNKWMIDKIIDCALKVNDIPFIHRFFDWFLMNDRISQLFDVKVKYLEDYLCLSTNTNDDHKRKLPHLISYYSTTKSYHKLFTLINKLIHMPGFNICQRHTFLTQALQASKSLLNENENENGDRNQDIFDSSSFPDCELYFEQRLQLCNLQMNITSKMESMSHMINNADDMQMLNATLINIEQMYEMCNKYGIWDCALDCLSFSDDEHFANIVHSCWLAMIAQTIRSVFDADDHQHYRQRWMQIVCQRILMQLKKYDINKQPFMFDSFAIVQALHSRNFELSANIKQMETNAHMIIHILLLSYLSLLDIIDLYHQLLLKTERWTENIAIISYLLTNIISKQSRNSTTIKQALVLSNECLRIQRASAAEISLMQPFYEFNRKFGQNMLTL